MADLFENSVTVHSDFRGKADARRRVVRAIGICIAFVGSVLSLSAFMSPPPYSILYFVSGIVGASFLGASFYFSACGESHVKEEIWWQAHATRLLEESSPRSLEVSIKSSTIAGYRGATAVVFAVVIHCPDGRDLPFRPYLDDLVPPGYVLFSPFEKTFSCLVRMDEEETTALIELGELRIWCLRAGMTPGSVFQQLAVH